VDVGKHISDVGKVFRRLTKYRDGRQLKAKNYNSHAIDTAGRAHVLEFQKKAEGRGAPEMDRSGKITAPMKLIMGWCRRR